MRTAVPDGRNRDKIRALRQSGWVLLILLVAAVLRLVNLSGASPEMAIPPGMTHDEADHGLTAWEIINGARDIYFTIGYGREPLYDYATAAVMLGTGPRIFAARLTSAYFSLLMIAAVYAWSRRAFGRPVGLLAAAGLAVGFWPVMAGRQALRSIALPALFALAVLFFWCGLRIYLQGSGGAEERRRRGEEKHLRTPAPLLLFAFSGILLGLTCYTYIPARVMWLAFPALAAYLILATPSAGRNARRLLAGLGLTLAVAALVATPLFFHLVNNPGLEVRIDELGAPLRIAADGDLGPLWFNARRALRLFTIEGDHTWRYNIPGRPFLGPVMGGLFYAGLLMAGWSAVRGLWSRWSGKQGSQGDTPTPQSSLLSSTPLLPCSPSPLLPLSPAASFLALVWLALGFAPVLVTGPGLSTTQAIGVMPVLYVFPALALVGGYGLLKSLAGRSSTLGSKAAKTGEDIAHPGLPALAFLGGLLALALFTILAAQTARDYFGRWANEPEVRVQYETTMVTALRYLDENGRGPATVSTITPGRYHTPAVALMTLHNPAVEPRWFDGRRSLLLPSEAGALLVVPGFTPIPPELQRYLSDAVPVEELPMRPDDIDRPVQIYKLGDPTLALARMTPPESANGAATGVDFHNIVLLGYDLTAAEVRPGDTLSLVTAWRLEQPLPEASLFAHLVGSGSPQAVADGLGAPGESWIAGDILLQWHTMSIPADTTPGTYPLAVGVYTQDDGQRLVTDTGDSMAVLTTVTVLDE
ncbi:MAG: hypothetical protein KBD86_00035 [Candidatus Promineofilum sp.]|nr:hypothetical protein [Promineifilum sp.]